MQGPLLFTQTHTQDVHIVQRLKRRLQFAFILRPAAVTCAQHHTTHKNCQFFMYKPKVEAYIISVAYLYFAQYSIEGFLFVSPCHSKPAPSTTSKLNRKTVDIIAITWIVFTRLAAKLSQSHPSSQTQNNYLESREASGLGRLFRGLQWNIAEQTSSPVPPPLLTVYPKIE